MFPHTPAYDPESFDKENYLLEVQPGESVKVGNTTYTAPVSGMKLQGNPDGNPVIVINREGEAVKVGDKSYAAGSDGTKIVVNGPNNITLVDNGSETDNSALVVDSIGTMIIDGNTITCSGTENAGYTITKTTGGADSIDVADGTRVSVKIPSGGSSLFVPEQMQYNGKTTSSSGALIKAPSSGTINIALDKTTQDENENYVLKLLASGNTVLTPITDGEGNITGFDTSVYIPQPQPDPNPGNGNNGTSGDQNNSGGESKEEPSEEETSAEDETEETDEETETEEETGEEETEGTEKETEEVTSEPATGENENESNQDENVEKPTEKPVISIQTVNEGSEIPVKEDVKVILRSGEISLQVVSDAGSVIGTVQQILEACFIEEELEQIKSGTNAEVRTLIVKIGEDVSKKDEDIIQDAYQKYEKSIEGLQFGEYVDIVIETKIGDGEWKQVHELNDEIEITLSISDQLLADGRSYYVVRNHNDKCTILEDLDSDPNTITIRTGQFSTYAILYTDADVEHIDVQKLNQKTNVLPWILFGAFVALIILFGVEIERRRRIRQRIK